MPDQDASRRTEATRGGYFVTTRWSVVLATRDEKRSHEALTWLCERYWLPLYAYVRSRGHTPDDAKDLVQGFFERFLSRDLAQEANAERGRFRSFLLGCLNHYLSEEHKRTHRLKRGGGHEFIRLDDPIVEARVEAELTDARQPEAAFDRQWAVALMDYSLERLRLECEADGRNGRFEVLKPCLTEAAGDASQAELAAKLKVTVTAVKLIIHRLRRRYREIVREEVAETVAGTDEVDAELRHLLAALRT
jgi:RNA polymerase sigma-70 factor (ECF subfamily)